MSIFFYLLSVIGFKRSYGYSLIDGKGSISLPTLSCLLPLGIQLGMPLL